MGRPLAWWGWGGGGPGYWGAGLIGLGVGVAVGRRRRQVPMGRCRGVRASGLDARLYCAQRYRSFNSHTGYFTGYDGQPYFCQ